MIPYLEMSDSQFDFFRSIVYDEARIKLGDTKRSLLQSRVMHRMRELKLQSFSDYVDFLNENYDNELYSFINCVTTNKTDFFRENRHFVFLSENVFPEYESKGKTKIRAWSAGCSTGPEPYSMAMTFFEYFGRAHFPDVKILATDIDTQVIASAEKGKYAAGILADVDTDLLKKYFLRGTGDNTGFFKVKDFVREIISFRRLNFRDERFPMKEKFDIIFCRNVIIYFDRDFQRELFDKFYHYLADDGYLFVGHSENLLAVSDKFRHLGHTIYRKADL